MQIIIARIMGLVLPLFGRAITNSLINANIGLVSIFLANLSFSSIAYAIGSTTQAGGLSNTPAGANLLNFLSQRGITGPFAQVFGYWMMVATLIGKILYVSFGLILSPIFGAILYGIFKSMGGSLYFLQEIYDMLPIPIKNYFIYVNKEMMNLLSIGFSPVAETGKEYGKYLLYGKTFLNISSMVGNSFGFQTEIFGEYMLPVINYIFSFKIVQIIYGGTYVLSLFFAGIFVSVMPDFVTNFVMWLFSTNLFHLDGCGRVIGGIRTILGG